eukprot:1145200-Pelagomonas_calceolata.AAC.1
MHFKNIELAPWILQRPAAPPWCPVLQPASSNLLLATQASAKSNSGHGGGLWGPGRTSLLLYAFLWDEIRLAPGALATIQNQLQYYQQPFQTLTAAVWA